MDVLLQRRRLIDLTSELERMGGRRKAKAHRRTVRNLIAQQMKTFNEPQHDAPARRRRANARERQARFERIFAVRHPGEYAEMLNRRAAARRTSAAGAETRSSELLKAS